MHGRRGSRRAARALDRAQPVLAFAKVATDPELRSLKARPVLAALASGKRAAASARDIDRQPMVGLGGRVVSVPIREQSWGTEQEKIALAFFDARTGGELHRSELVGWLDSDELGRVRPQRSKGVAARYAETTSWMSELGFAVDAAASTRAIDAGARAGAIQAAGISFERDQKADGIAVRPAGRAVGLFRAIAYERPARFDHLPAANAIVARWTTDLPEGCDAGVDGAHAELLPLAER